MNPIKLLTSDPLMKRYYISFSVLSVLVMLVIIVNVVGSSALKHDYTLETQIGDQQSLIGTYVSTHNKLPDIVADAGVKETKGIDYKKISDTRYMLCADFKTKSNGYQSPPIAVVNGLKNDGVQSGVNLDVTNTHFANGDQGNQAHDKGYTCLYYQPYELTDEVLRPNLVCQGDRFKHTLSNQQVVKSVDLVNNTLGLASYIVSYGTTNTPATAGPSSVITIYQVKNAKFYGANCQAIKLSDIKVNDRVQIYYDDTTTEVGAVWVTLPVSVVPLTNTKPSLQ